MNAYAKVDKYNEKFATSSALIARIEEANITDFSKLEWPGGKLAIQADEALYLYGGRQALIDALPKGDKQIIAQGFLPLALFRVQKTVGGAKKKQLLMLTPVQNGIPPGIRKKLIQLYGQDTEEYVNMGTLTRVIGGLKK